jgi:NAD(P)-dependent dehydrogenase (short-subunit alcohol dehydrogenase family)
MEDFAGKTAVITGAGSGMGRAYAHRFGREGMDLVLGDVETAALERVKAELEAEGRRVVAVPTDVSDPKAVENLRDRALEAFGTVHLVINNAGVEGYLDGRIWEATTKDWEWTLGVNLWGVIYGVRIFLPILVAQDDGYIVNTSSMTGVVRASNMYGIAKHAVRALSETIYGDLKAAGSKVGVSVLCPGIIATNLFLGSRNRPERLRNEGPTPDSGRGQTMRQQMHERLSQGMPPEEVADIVVQAIREERFYVLTDHEWDDRIKAWQDDIMQRRNPVIEPMAAGR